MQAQITNQKNSSSQHRRHIRSFVKRSRPITPKKQQILDELGKKYILELTPKTEIINYQKIFGNDAKIILEIGFGMGESLWQMVKNFPEYNFIGIEVHKPGIVKLLEHLKQEPLNNIRIYYADALNVLTQCIPDNSVNQILLYFPDPWPKKRHHKRRIVQPAFAALIRSKLKPNGIFHFITDWKDYAEHSLKILTNTEGLKIVSFANFDEYPVNNLLKSNKTCCETLLPKTTITKFERRAIKDRRNIWEIIVAQS